MTAVLPKLIVILGPTASGKTELALQLAKKFNGEIISADSRQLYKQMPIGTGQPAGEWTTATGEKTYVIDGVPHYGIDMINPDEEFSLSDFKKFALERIEAIRQRGRVPLLVGGTGLYIWSIVDNLDMPAVAPNKELRQKFEKKSLDELVLQLKKNDPEAYAIIDLKNPRRVIRALEVALLSGESFAKQQKKKEPLFDTLQIGIRLGVDELYQRIDKRVDVMMQSGLVAEVQVLVAKGYRWQLPSMSGLGYKQIGWYLAGECSLEEAVASIKRETKQYAKRQLTWFKRDERIWWVEGGARERAEELVRKFLF